MTSRESNDRINALIRDVRELLASLRLAHRYCDDCWYSCPKSEDGCCNPDKGTDCNCGADAHNAKIDAFLLARTEKP